jgi:hypothetical protein
MPDDPTRPDAIAGEAQFRADLLAYLDSLPAHELADLLGELPRAPDGYPDRVGCAGQR